MDFPETLNPISDYFYSLTKILLVQLSRQEVV